MRRETYVALDLRAKKKKRTPASEEHGVRDRGGRTDILRVAAKEFAAKGFHGATTAGIARAAGVTQPLVHHHFGSKLGLWASVLDDLFGELRALQEGTFRDLQGVELEAWLRVFLRQFVLFSARRPELARIMVVEGAPTKGLDPSIEAHIRPQMQQLKSFVQQLFDERGITQSRIEVELLCFLVLGASTHPFLVAGSAKRIFGIDVSELEIAQLYADVVVRTMFGSLDALAVEAERKSDRESQSDAPGAKSPSRGRGMSRARNR